MQRIHMHPCYVLHKHAFRDSSFILDVFSREYGRVALVARGARRPRSNLRGILQPFHLLLMSWRERGEVGTLSAVEPGGVPCLLIGDALLSAFYLNELLLRLVNRHDPLPDLFDKYASTLAGITSGGRLQTSVLRNFEKSLLECLGYGLNLTTDIDSGMPVERDLQYAYVLEQGPRRLVRSGQTGLVISGAALLALDAGSFQDEDALTESRRLLTAAIELYLGGQVLRTRKVLQSLRMRRTASQSGGVSDEGAMEKQI